MTKKKGFKGNSNRHALNARGIANVNVFGSTIENAQSMDCYPLGNNSENGYHCTIRDRSNNRKEISVDQISIEGETAIMPDCGIIANINKGGSCRIFTEGKLKVVECKGSNHMFGSSQSFAIVPPTINGEKPRMVDKYGSQGINRHTIYVWRHKNRAIAINKNHEVYSEKRGEPGSYYLIDDIATPTDNKGEYYQVHSGEGCTTVWYDTLDEAKEAMFNSFKTGKSIPKKKC